MRTSALFLLLLSALLAGCGQTPSRPAKPAATAPAKVAAPVAKTETASTTPSVAAQPAEQEAASPPAPVVPIAPAGRVIVMSPVGPLVLELVVTVDGAALTSARQKQIEELLHRLAGGSAGGLSWEAALADARFSLGESPRSRQDRKILIASVDTNRDQLVQADEAAEYYARLDGIGPALGFSVSEQGWSDRNASRLWQVADANSDGAVDAEELGRLREVLASYDADGNDMLDAAELGEQSMAMEEVQTPAARRSNGGNSKLAILCDATFRGDGIAYLLEELYPASGEANVLSTVGGLIRALDTNGNGRLDRREPLGFSSIEPHARIIVRFDGQSSPLTPTIEWLDTQLAGVAQNSVQDEEIEVRLAENRLQVSQSENQSGQGGGNNPLAAQFAALDADANGYLEEKELPQGNMLVRFFKAADADNDGKLYQAEIEALLAWQQGLRNAAVRLEISSAADPLFGALDLVADGRLTQRELRRAAELLSTYDRNADGRLELAELPVAIRMDFSRSKPLRSNAMPETPTEEQAAAAKTEPTTNSASPPDWFVRMDVNGDGDVSAREFLGTAEQFSQLDADQDGFLIAAEAAAASR